eukprot:3726663-Rhodomonas_salina.1
MIAQSTYDTQRRSTTRFLDTMRELHFAAKAASIAEREGLKSNDNTAGPRGSGLGRDQCPRGCPR